MKKKRLSSCNILDASSTGRHLWHFEVDKEKVRLNREEIIPPSGTLPQKVAAKDWQNLWQPKLNIGWLPGNQVFLRVVQLPAADRQELQSMLEFQLEKISPLPVTQVLWSVEMLPGSDPAMQTALVCIVSQDAVEDYLGQLEAAQFQADRLEVPQMNQILAGGVKEDGAWIYLDSVATENLCTVAWWKNGALQQLQLLHLPEIEVEGNPEGGEGAAGRARLLQEQLMQIAWAGELEGWLTLPIQWHIVADEATAREWEPLVAAWADEPPKVSPPIPPKALAEYSASRAATGDPISSLLPVEFATRYHQQYIDRLWMGGLGALVGLYILGVAVYMVSLQVYQARQGKVQAQVKGIANSYTNALRLKEQVEVMQEQVNLKYAALDCVKITSELLPPEFNLTWLVFGRGKTLELHGSAPPGQETKVTDFNEAMRNATVEGRQLFSQVGGPIMNFRPGSPNISWNFQCQLNVPTE